MSIFSRRGVFTPLANADFRRLLVSNSLWWQTSMMEIIVLGWLVLEMTDSAWQVSVIAFLRSVPFLLFGFISGPIIDHFGRRKIILAAQTTTTCVYIAISLLLWAGMLEVWHLGAGALIVGSAWSLDWPSRRSLLPDLVGKAHTVDAMLLENFVQNISRMLGPFLAGVLIAAAGAVGCYIALAFFAGASLLILTGLTKQPVPREHMPSNRSAFQLIGEGLRYVRSQDPIFAVLLITAIMNSLVFSYTILLPVFARDVLDVGPVGLGMLGAAAGVGALIGLAIVGRLRNSVSRGLIFGVGCLFQTIMIFGFASSTLFALSLALLVLSGIGQACFSTMQSSIILLASSDEMRSRAMGTLVLAIGAGPLGRLQTGALAQAFGAPFAMHLNTVIATVCVALVMVKLPGMRRRLDVADSPPPSAPVRQPA